MEGKVYTRQQIEEMVHQSVIHINEIVRYSDILSAMVWDMKRWLEKKQKDLREYQ